MVAFLDTILLVARSQPSMSIRRETHNLFEILYIYIYIDYQSKIFGHPQFFLFLFLKVLFLMKHVFIFISQQNTRNTWTYSWIKTLDNYFKEKKEGYSSEYFFFLIPGTKVDYIIGRYQETGQNKTKNVEVLFTNPSARAGYDTRSIFKRSLTGLNSEFSFS